MAIQCSGKASYPLRRRGLDGGRCWVRVGGAVVGRWATGGGAVQAHAVKRDGAVGGICAGGARAGAGLAHNEKMKFESWVKRGGAIHRFLRFAQILRRLIAIPALAGINSGLKG